MIEQGVHRPTGPPAHPLLAPARRGSALPVGRWTPGGPVDPFRDTPSEEPTYGFKGRLDRGMANRAGRARRPVGVGAKATPSTVRLIPEAWQKAETAAAALGVSRDAYLDALLLREQLDERGRPLWWTDPVPQDQVELPLTQSA